MVIIAFSYLMLLRIEDNPLDEKLPTLPQVRREMSRIFVRRGLELRLKTSPEEADAILDDMPYLIPE